MTSILDSVASTSYLLCKHFMPSPAVFLTLCHLSSILGDSILKSLSSFIILKKISNYSPQASDYSGKKGIKIIATQ